MKPAIDPLPTTPTAAMLRTLAVVAALCGTIITAAHQGTQAAIEGNKRLAIERAVFKVIPAAVSVAEYLALPEGRLVKVGADKTAPAGAIKFYAGFDASGRLVGVAAEGAAKGYADTVRILFAWEASSQAVTGFGVVSSRETPGIGDKILVDKDFLANFPLEAKLSADMKTLANAIRTVKHGTKAYPWEIDAIAGATITSRAVGRAIDETAQALLPRIAPHLAQLEDRP
ncbi:MAG: FMN-binding protein [Rhodocyclaceae bacterium]|nr:FMN-binding protein [Rhodocyclaceae bacterium]